MPNIPLDPSVLRSPAGYGVYQVGDTVVCEGTKRVYPVVNGNVYLYDMSDVPESLAHEVESYGSYVESSLVPDRNIPAERIYADAKAVNTEFMFTTLNYAQRETRRVVELGAWRCESIAKFADLGFDSYALDFFPGMMDAAARLHLGRPYRRISTPMAVLPFKDQTIDLLYMHATLHHALPRNQADFEWCNPHNMHDALCEVRRVLKAEGAFFLLGEGVYPEGMPISERHHEKRAQAGETPYESWYTMSEYEAAFRKAGIFPALMSNQTGLEFELIGYENGKRVNLVKVGDLVYRDSYHRIEMMAAWNAGGDWPNRILPAWINLV